MTNEGTPEAEPSSKTDEPAAAATAAEPHAARPTPAASPRVPVAAFMLLCGLVLSLQATADFYLHEEPWRPRAAISVVCLGFTVGMAAGGIWIGVQRRLSLRPLWMRICLWSLLGSSLTYWMVDDLGVFARLGGKDGKLAIAALAAALVAGLGLIGGALVLQPSPKRPLGWLPGLSIWYRLPVTLILLATAAAATYVDRTQFPTEHDNAHLLLEWVGFATTCFALMLLRPRLVEIRGVARFIVLPPVVALVVVPFVLLTASREAELQEISERPLSALALDTARRLVDVDFDGHAPLLGGLDCNPWRGSVYPGAPEIPGNGIDDNCMFGDASVTFQSADEVPIPETPSPTSVIVVTVDTVVAKRTSMFGAKRDTTPKLAEWAKRSANFTRGYSTAPWTSLALSSLFRGVYPRRLTWTRVYETSTYRLIRGPVEDNLEEDERVRAAFGIPSNEQRMPLQWWLQRRGMYTVAVIDDGHTEFLAEHVGGFPFYDEYYESDTLPPKEQDDEGLTDRAIEVLGGMPTDQEFFMWVHYFGPHSPSTSHAGIESYGSSPADRYDHELRFMDEHLGRFLEAVETAARKRNIAVFITADHGEVITGGGRSHGTRLNETMLHVPLLMRAPGVKPGKVKGMAGIIDIMPTVLNLTETPAPNYLDGMDLRDVVDGTEEANNRIMLSETWHLQRDGGEVKRDWVSVYDGKYKLSRDLLKQITKLTRQSGSRNLSDTVEAPELEHELNRYLEENSVTLED